LQLAAGILDLFACPIHVFIKRDDRTVDCNAAVRLVGGAAERILNPLAVP
jgi:hypothetical protein